MKKTGVFLLSALLCLLTACGLQATRTYEYAGQNMVIDTQACVLEYAGEQYTYALTGDSWSITWPDGEYYQETEVSQGNRLVSCSWGYGPGPESRGYLSKEVLLEYIQKASGKVAFYQSPVWWGGVALCVLGVLTMMWPRWLRVKGAVGRVVARVLGAVATFAGLCILYLR